MDDSSNQAPTRKGAPPPGPKKPPPMSPAELEAFIKRSPKHKKVVALYTPILVMGGLSTLLAAVVIGTSCGWGVEVIRAHKWLVFHYTVVGLLALCHAAFCWRFRVDIENLEDPSIFQIDIGRIIITAVVQAAFLFYIYIKLRTVADSETFNLGCVSSCSGKRKWMKLAPLLTALLLILFAIAQLWLCLILYHNPVLNPPPPPKKKADASSESEGDEEKKGLMSDEETLVGSMPGGTREKSLGRKKSRGSESRKKGREFERSRRREGRE